jgi:AbrB family looped-hinge helix DNA binding protein
MNDFDTMTVSKEGRCTLPKWWRDVSGLSRGGNVEVRLMRDGKNTIVLIPKPAHRRGAVGLLKLFAKCPAPFPPPQRHQGFFREPLRAGSGVPHLRAFRHDNRKIW